MASSDLMPVEIFLNREEKASLDESAVREGLTTEDYLRRAVLYVMKLEDQLETLDQADAADIIRAASSEGTPKTGTDHLPSLDGILLRLRRAEERYLALERRTTRLETLIELTAVGATPSGLPALESGSAKSG